jgi:hypothetical protein
LETGRWPAEGADSTPFVLDRASQRLDPILSVSKQLRNQPSVWSNDGLALCGLLHRYEFGLRTTVRHVEVITVEPDFFTQL